MSEEEINQLLDRFWNRYSMSALNQQDQRLERIADEFRREHEELKTRAETAETKLKLYEALFGKLNLNMEVKNE